jgi:Mor family transcriptional regulator
MYGKQLFGEANGNFGKEMKPHVKETLLKIRRKLTEEQIQEIIILFNTSNYTQTQLSKQFNVSLTQIHRIVKGKSWGNKKHDEILTKKNLIKEDVIKMREEYNSGKFLQKELAIKYNIKENHVNRIINRKKWKNI